MPGSETACCPNDDGDLRPVAAHNRQGAPIMLDQCEGCGGLWFDKFELFAIDEKDALLLAQIDEQALRQPHCPRCGAVLDRFTDPNILANIQMLMCGACEGFWLNHGALNDFAAFRRSRHPAIDPALAAGYAKALAATSDAEKWDGIGQAGSRARRPEEHADRDTPGWFTATAGADRYGARSRLRYRPDDHAAAIRYLTKDGCFRLQARPSFASLLL
ncbi:MAG: zf-TFIIB domain-containing protein [Thermoleophilia bacterium]